MVSTPADFPFFGVSIFTRRIRCRSSSGCYMHAITVLSPWLWAIVSLSAGTLLFFFYTGLNFVADYLPRFSELKSSISSFALMLFCFSFLLLRQSLILHTEYLYSHPLLSLRSSEPSSFLSCILSLLMHYTASSPKSSSNQRYQEFLRWHRAFSCDLPS